jgi:hypothetical protein
VLSIAAALDDKGTLDGAEIDELIAEAEARDFRMAELAQREAFAAASRRAAAFLEEHKEKPG